MWPRKCSITVAQRVAPTCVYCTRRNIYSQSARALLYLDMRKDKKYTNRKKDTRKEKYRCEIEESQKSSEKYETNTTTEQCKSLTTNVSHKLGHIWRKLQICVLIHLFILHAVSNSGHIVPRAWIRMNNEQEKAVNGSQARMTYTEALSGFSWTNWHKTRKPTLRLYRVNLLSCITYHSRARPFRVNVGRTALEPVFTRFGLPCGS